MPSQRPFLCPILGSPSCGGVAAEEAPCSGHPAADKAVPCSLHDATHKHQASCQILDSQGKGALYRSAPALQMCLLNCGGEPLPRVPLPMFSRSLSPRSTADCQGIETQNPENETSIEQHSAMDEIYFF